MKNPLKIERWTERIFLAVGIVFIASVLLNLLFNLDLNRWYVGIVQIAVGLGLLTESAWRSFRRSTYSNLSQTKNVLYIVTGIAAMLVLLFGVLNLPMMISMSVFLSGFWTGLQVISTAIAGILLVIYMFI